jgi:hypothetical protein
MNLTRLYDTNVVFGYLFTNGRSYIDPFFIQDDCKMRYLNRGLDELQALVQRRFGSFIAWDTINTIISESNPEGSYPLEILDIIDFECVLKLISENLSDKPDSRNAKKHDLSFTDTSNIIVGQRLQVDIITTDQRMCQLALENDLGIKIINPYPENFVEVITNSNCAVQDINSESLVNSREIKTEKYLQQLADLCLPTDNIQKINSEIRKYLA